MDSLVHFLAAREKNVPVLYPQSKESKTWKEHSKEIHKEKVSRYSSLDRKQAMTLEQLGEMKVCDSKTLQQFIQQLKGFMSGTPHPEHKLYVHDFREFPHNQRSSIPIRFHNRHFQGHYRSFPSIEKNECDLFWMILEFNQWYMFVAVNVFEKDDFTWHSTFSLFWHSREPEEQVQWYLHSGHGLQQAFTYMACENETDFITRTLQHVVDLPTYLGKSFHLTWKQVWPLKKGHDETNIIQVSKECDALSLAIATFFVKESKVSKRIKVVFNDKAKSLRLTLPTGLLSGGVRDDCLQIPFSSAKDLPVLEQMLTNSFLALKRNDSAWWALLKKQVAHIQDLMLRCHPKARPFVSFSCSEPTMDIKTLTSHWTFQLEIAGEGYYKNNTFYPTPTFSRTCPILFQFYLADEECIMKCQGQTWKDTRDVMQNQFGRQMEQILQIILQDPSFKIGAL